MPTFESPLVTIYSPESHNITLHHNNPHFRLSGFLSAGSGALASSENTTVSFQTESTCGE